MSFECEVFKVVEVAKVVKVFDVNVVEPAGEIPTNVGVEHRRRDPDQCRGGLKVEWKVSLVFQKY